MVPYWSGKRAGNQELRSSCWQLDGRGIARSSTLMPKPPSLAAVDNMMVSNILRLTWTERKIRSSATRVIRALSEHWSSDSCLMPRCSDFQPVYSNPKKRSSRYATIHIQSYLALIDDINLSHPPRSFLWGEAQEKPLRLTMQHKRETRHRMSQIRELSLLKE